MTAAAAAVAGTCPTCAELRRALSDAEAAIRSLEATEELLRERLRNAGRVYRLMVRRERLCQRTLGRQRAAELRALLDDEPVQAGAGA